MMQYKVVGVQFKKSGKKYFFDPGKLKLKKGDHVIVETIRGLEFGTVVSDPKLVDKEDVFLPLKKVIRIGTKQDIKQDIKNREDEKSTLHICKQLVRKNKLEMRLLGCEYMFDRTKLIFYFTAEGRVDFRQLVKDLAHTFRLRIELRQIGVRDAAKMIGGLGPCGRVLCCNSFLGEFSVVTIKMVKNQQLSLNPAKVSGLCGKLLCCLNYENDTYLGLINQMPSVGDDVRTELGEGRISSINMISETVVIKYADRAASHHRNEIVEVLKQKVKNHDEVDLSELVD